MTSLNELRQLIDQIDQEILKLFIKRIDLVKAIKHIKIEEKRPILDSNRESEILDKLKNITQDDALFPYVRHLFMTIMAISKEVLACSDTD